MRRLYLLFWSPRLETINFKYNINPVKVWENINLPYTKIDVYREVKSFAGIYLIINLVNGKLYVGSGTVGRIQLRFHKHLFSGKGKRLV